MKDLHLFIYTFIISFSFATVVCAEEDNFLSFVHYTNEDGLPSSYVKSITQDHHGFIWLAIRSSVCRFDGKKFINYQLRDARGQMHEIRSDNVFTICDTILVCQTLDKEYYVFDFDREYFKPYQLLNDVGELQAFEPTEDGFWFCRENELFFLDIYTGKLSELEEKVEFAHIPDNIPILNVKEKDNTIVALSNNELIILDLDLGRMRDYPFPIELGEEPILTFFLDSYNCAWIGVHNAGICRVNLKNGKSEYFSNEAVGKYHILHNMVYCVIEDHSGRIWIGTEDGLCIWSPEAEKLTYHQHDLRDTKGLNTNPINSAFCDKNGNMWLGTYFGGINFWNADEPFFKTWNSGVGDRHLGGNVISCITEDYKGNLWIGMEDLGLNMVDITTGKVSLYQSNKSNKKGLSFNNIHGLLFESDVRLWIATYTGGINILNTRTGNFEYINRNNHPELPSDRVYQLVKKRDSIFISTTNGVAVYNVKTKEISPFYEEVLGNVWVASMCDAGNKLWFSSLNGVYFYDSRKEELLKFDRIPDMKAINFVKQDSKGRIWIGDRHNGLCYYDEKLDKIEYFNQKKGFPVSWIFSLEEGEDGYFWASSDKGLVRFHPETNVFVLFDRDSGIPFEQFNYRASFKDSRGNIYFGGNRGMVSFNESHEPIKNRNLDVAFTGLQLFNQHVTPGEDSPIQKSLNRLSEVAFEYKQNVFTIEYAALNYANQGRCQYAYYLENFEESWNYVGNRDFATYTNLNPGKYTFHVKASLNKSEWGENERILKIVIKPPFWLSPIGYFMYFLVFVLILIGFYAVGSRIQKSKALAEMERREKEYGAELNQAKLEFFTNISHEIRTPLTLIIGPLSQMIKESNVNPALKKKLKGINKNVTRLLSLINQLLDFRKIERGKEKLKVSEGNICRMLRDLRESFSTISESKGIDFTINMSEADQMIWFDYPKVEKILVNLLSNAFKYTAKGESIIISAKVVIENKKPKLVLLVADTGKGIEASKLKNVFNRYYQEDEEEATGSGIGLAYVHSLVTLHKGKIIVESKVGKGSEFLVSLPVSKVDYSEDELSMQYSQYDTIPNLLPEVPTADTLQTEKMDFSINKSSVLVVDDNIELLEFISESLQNSYSVYTAENGKEGLKMVKEISPDLIISDVMMPGMNGLELTEKIKTEIETSHIPVILLTAKTGMDNQFVGLKVGADVYIEKPFFPHILEQNILNILNTRKNLIERFKKDAFIPPSEITYTESDRVFVETLTTLIKDNIDKPSLDVSFVTSELGISRSLLHLKLKKITDCSATEFVRSIRLREAVKLIAEGECNITEAAYRTGFSSPAYFTRRFKDFFGKSPREYFEL